ncbi:arginine 2,3-aminomutase [Paraburkholderia sp. JHI2823]|uniref:arginine 2,3-aminomutase n=1 Tax=Paraburkholderia sp. JHI2823 TaxID=3112960 RepID=UPI00317480E2
MEASKNELLGNAVQADWSNWHWQMKNSVTTLEQLAGWIHVTHAERDAIESVRGKYLWRITPYYASLMDPEDAKCPVRLQSVPSAAEMLTYPGADIDPVSDASYRKTNRVIHKYPDRVVFLVTSMCPVYCRHCTRKYHTTDVAGTYFGESEGVSMEPDFDYLASHAEIRDVLLTGGDPLSYNDRKLEEIVSRLRMIPHIEIIRIGSRCPVVLPMRITEELCRMLDKYQPIWFQTHFNHPKEITKEASAACDRLLRHGIPVQNQSVLLKGVNDSVEIMRALVTGLLRIRVRPYYLYHCDNVTGVSHFMTPLDKGIEIIDGLFGHTTGFAVPDYIITTDLGKIPVGRSYIRRLDDGCEIRNYLGQTEVIQNL